MNTLTTRWRVDHPLENRCIHTTHGRAEDHAASNLRRCVAVRDEAVLWWQKWRWYQRNSLPWNRLAIHREFARRRAFCRWPVHGNVLEAFREGRLEIGEHTLFEPDVWITLG